MNSRKKFESKVFIHFYLQVFSTVLRVNEIISHTRVISSSRWLVSSVSNHRSSSNQVHSKGIVCNIRIERNFQSTVS